MTFFGCGKRAFSFRPRQLSSGEIGKLAVEVVLFTLETLHFNYARVLTAMLFKHEPGPEALAK